MKIGIIGAMDEEIKELKDIMSSPKETVIGKNSFFTGNIFEKECVLVKSGVGKVFASMTAQILISNFGVDRIIFTGLAGSLNKEVKIGDIVIGEKCAQYDLDASELGFKVGQVPYTDYRFFECDKKMIQHALKTKLEDTKIMKGTILTGDLFLNHRMQARYNSVFEELKGDCIEMEGAAVAQVCFLNNISCCIIRIISDSADENALEDFEKFKHVVAHKSTSIIEALIKHV